MAPQTIKEAADPGIRLDHLRDAIRANRVSFPAPIPVFECQHRADIQWRLVELYFVRGWSCVQLGQRYQVTATRIQQLLRGWVKRAVALGYLQEIPADDFQAAPLGPLWEEKVEVAVGALLPHEAFVAPESRSERSRPQLPGL